MKRLDVVLEEPVGCGAGWEDPEGSIEVGC